MHGDGSRACVQLQAGPKPLRVVVDLATGTGLVPALTHHGSPFDGTVTTVTWTAYDVVVPGNEHLWVDVDEALTHLISNDLT